MHSEKTTCEEKTGEGCTGHSTLCYIGYSLISVWDDRPRGNTNLVFNEKSQYVYQVKQIL